MDNEMMPTVQPVKIADLRPTQMTVGFREVALKRRQLRAKRPDKAGTFIAHHFIPTVLGPKGRCHIVDHHHLARAMHEEGLEDVFVTVICDLSGLDKEAFLVVLDNRSWMHPFDASGTRRSYADIPKSIGKLEDDPYRSLAGEVRRLGGYAKDTTPFAEFLWADFFRRRVPREVVDDDFDRASRHAFQLARLAGANYLPGWSGPDT
ncbi:ParB-like protein [Mesorhizobium sp. ANAO-SY3R2]|uniref:ParB-like protein n=1 Tax=Mesorhizobium sp. ANAO-SY3R2 TaxID=3166644 RepID=UPI003670F760